MFTDYTTNNQAFIEETLKLYLHGRSATKRIKPIQRWLIYDGLAQTANNVLGRDVTAGAVGFGDFGNFGQLFVGKLSFFPPCEIALFGSYTYCISRQQDIFSVTAPAGAETGSVSIFIDAVEYKVIIPAAPAVPRTLDEIKTAMVNLLNANGFVASILLPAPDQKIFVTYNDCEDHVIAVAHTSVPAGAINMTHDQQIPAVRAIGQDGLSLCMEKSILLPDGVTVKKLHIGYPLVAAEVNTVFTKLYLPNGTNEADEIKPGVMFQGFQIDAN